MTKIKEIGNTIHPSIQLEMDCPALHKDNKLPMLDIKIWTQTKEETQNQTDETEKKEILEIDGIGHRKERQVQILHEFYQKDVSSKSTIHARSAMSWKDKRTVITQEILRILLRCSPKLPWTETVKHIENYMKRLQFSGYSKRFRTEVWKSALKAYREIKRKDQEKEQPMYRNKKWKRNERERNRRTKKEGWYKKGGYKSIIFVPATPGSELKKKYECILRGTELGIKVIERTGTKLKHMIQRTNPFEKKKCKKEDECFVCERGKGDCKKESVTYEIQCDRCNYIYVGETARTGHYRGRQHLQLLKNKQQDSVLYRHITEQHKEQTDQPQFKMTITGQYRTALERQVMEAIRIEHTPREKRMNTREEWGHSKLLTSIVMT